jgi:hypothetical protein
MSLSPYMPHEPEELLRGEAVLRAIRMPLSVREHPLRTERINVSQVASKARCYIGEQVTFYTRLQIREAVTGFHLQVRIPVGLEVIESHCLSHSLQQSVSAFSAELGSELIWQIDESIAAGSAFEFCIETRVRLHGDDFVAVVRANVQAASQENGDELEDVEELSLMVSTSAAYLDYLPAFYSHDRFMRRYLMLFESFWGPIDQQIDGIDYYFDPTLTPEEFLPWLASWLGLPAPQSEALTEMQSAPGRQLSEEPPPDRLQLPSPAGEAAFSRSLARRTQRSIAGAQSGLPEQEARDYLVLPDPAKNLRKLLKRVLPLRKMRGTRRGLQQYLELYTGAEAHIIEHRAENFVLGQDARMGRRIALGRQNHPHTFSVILRFPVPQPWLDEAGEALMAERLANIRRQVIPIIDDQKPAHTSYTLQIEVVPE